MNHANTFNYIEQKVFDLTPLNPFFNLLKTNNDFYNQDDAILLVSSTANISFFSNN